MQLDWTILRSGEQIMYRLRGCMSGTATAGLR